MHKKSIAVIGCGAAAEKYYKSTLLKNQTKFEKIYAVDVDPNSANVFLQGFNNCEILTDYRQLSERVNGAIVAVPPQYHYKITKYLLENKIHVLCEKPLTEKPDEATQLVCIAEQNNVKLCVNNTRRLFPNFIKIKNIIKENKSQLHTIDFIEVNKFGWKSKTNFYVDPRKSSKGILLDLGAHVLDLICWWLDDIPQITRCVFDSFGGPESMFEGFGSKDGISIYVLLNRLIDLGSLIRIEFSDFIVKTDLLNWKQIIIEDKSSVKIQNIKTKYKKYDEIVETVVENFFEVIEQKTEPCIEGKDVLSSIKLIDRCYENCHKFEPSWNQTLEKYFNG